MRKLVGQRANPDPETKRAVALVELFLNPAGPKPTTIEFNRACAACRAPIRITLSEVIVTGEIWVEGPDRCSCCGHRISNEGAQFQALSQQAIEGLFGRH